jgi:transcriptional repressor NrdR
LRDPSNAVSFLQPSRRQGYRFARIEGGRRHTQAYERIEEVPFLVVKKDGRREKFDRQKVLSGLLKACEKRPVGMPALAALVDQVEARLAENSDRELSTTDIGEMLMGELRGIDHVAFVRFASVYRDFQDVEQFMNELSSLVRQKRGGQ